jgi:hypothetical protein
MLKPSCGAPASTGHVLEVRATLTATNGGASEMDVNEFTAIPTGRSWTKAAMPTTPVGNAEKARRKAWGTAISVDGVMRDMVDQLLDKYI